MKTIIIIILIVVSLGIVGNMDYEDELLSTGEYCKNVYSGVWPDYRGDYNEYCYIGRIKE